MAEQGLQVDMLHSQENLNWGGAKGTVASSEMANRQITAALRQAPIYRRIINFRKKVYKSCFSG